MMTTIALRFGENFSPDCGTIAAHQQLIDKLGYVWYGKMGNPIAARIVGELKNQRDTKILLINSGKANRYWAHVEEVSKETPPTEGIPEYYRNLTERFKTWFKVTEFEPAPCDIMSKCFVKSSGNTLSAVSRHSINPYFIIEYNEDEVN